MTRNLIDLQSDLRVNFEALNMKFQSILHTYRKEKR